MTKLFKPFTLLSLFIACGLLLSACTKDEPPPIDEPTPYLTVGKDNVVFSTETATETISIRTNAGTWTPTVAADATSWLQVIQNGNDLLISTSKNENLATREGEIRVTAGTLSVTITVRQMGVEPAILVTVYPASIVGSGGAFTLSITSNVEYEIIVDADWIEANEEYPTRLTMVTTEYHFDVRFNASTDTRTTDIVIRRVGYTLTETVTITQEGQGEFTPSPGDEIGDIRVPVTRGLASSQDITAPIQRSFDGDPARFFRTANNPSFPVTLEYFFYDQERIDYLIHHPRIGGHNGHIIEVEIWGFSHDDPDTPINLGVHDFGGRDTPTRVTFDEPLLNPRMIRFVVKSSVGNSVVVTEMEFFRILLHFDPLTIFTDMTITELRPGITPNDIAQIPGELYRNIAFHLHNGTYPREFRIAEFRAWEHPRYWARDHKTSTLSLLDNPTGIFVPPGEDLIVFVGEMHGRDVGLRVINFYQPGGDGWATAASFFLQEGVNRFRVPRGGLVYVMYHTTPQDVGVAPPIKMHFATGRVNGFFDSQIHDASQWNARLEAAHRQDPNGNFDVIGRYAHLTFPTASFRSYTQGRGAELIDAFDDIVDLQAYFMGLHKFSYPTRSIPNRMFFHVVRTPGAWGFAAGYRTGYHIGTLPRMLNFTTLRGGTNYFDNAVWLPAHEVGHVFQTRPGFLWHGMTEVTVNVKSLWVQQQWGIRSRIDEQANLANNRFNNVYEAAFYQAFILRTPYSRLGLDCPFRSRQEIDVFQQLAPFWQLQLYFADVLGNRDVYKHLYEQVRRRPDLPTAGEQQLMFTRMMSEITQTNLVPFFQKWGFLSPATSPISVRQSDIDATIAHINNLGFPYPSYMIEYITDSNWRIFYEGRQVQPGTALKDGNIIRVNNSSNVVAFEVLDENNNLVFVATRAPFRADGLPANMRVYAVSFDGIRIPVPF